MNYIQLQQVVFLQVEPRNQKSLNTMPLLCITRHCIQTQFICHWQSFVLCVSSWLHHTITMNLQRISDPHNCRKNKRFIHWQVKLQERLTRLLVIKAGCSNGKVCSPLPLEAVSRASDRCASQHDTGQCNASPGDFRIQKHWSLQTRGSAGYNRRASCKTDKSAIAYFPSIDCVFLMSFSYPWYTRRVIATWYYQKSRKFLLSISSWQV